MVSMRIRRCHPKWYPWLALVLILPQLLTCSRDIPQVPYIPSGALAQWILSVNDCQILLKSTRNWLLGDCLKVKCYKQFPWLQMYKKFHSPCK